MSASARRCAAPLPEVTCEELKPPPTDAPSQWRAIRESAIALRCGEGPDLAWDVRPLVEMFQDKRVFKLADPVGSNEVGVFSAIMFKALARRGLVNIVAMPLPMDYQSELQAYVDGHDDPNAAIRVDGFLQNFYGATLMKTARTLNQAGAKIRLGAVDLPRSPEMPLRQIRQLSNRMHELGATVSKALPTSITLPNLTADELAQVDAFFDLVHDKKKDLCAELSADDCDRLEGMTHVLWASAFQTQSAFARDDRWFDRRQSAAYYILRTLIRSPDDRMYLHTLTTFDETSSSPSMRMAEEYPLTRGRVLSLGPAWGDGSVLDGFDGDYEISADPANIARALKHAPPHPLFVSTKRPDAACRANALGKEPVVNTRRTRAAVYDGYIHFGLLTSEFRPQDSRFSLETPLLE